MPSAQKLCLLATCVLAASFASATDVATGTAARNLRSEADQPDYSDWTRFIPNGQGGFPSGFPGGSGGGGGGQGFQGGGGGGGVGPDGKPYSFSFGDINSNFNSGQGGQGGGQGFNGQGGQGGGQGFNGQGGQGGGQGFSGQGGQGGDQGVNGGGGGGGVGPDGKPFSFSFGDQHGNSNTGQSK